MNQPDNAARAAVPGAGSPSPGPADADRLLQGVHADLELLDELGTQEQVPVFDRLHTALADALARTADTGPAFPGSPPGGPQGRPGA